VAALLDLHLGSLEAMLGLCALLYLLGACWFVLGTRRRHSSTEQTPLVSVVVAARDEAECIARCLHVLLTQNYPQTQYEIIVVDDDSTDGTDRIVGEFIGGPVEVRLLKTEGQGAKKAALSLGVTAAAGEVILTTDADCQISPGWIRGMVAHFTAGVGMVIGFAQIGSPNEINAVRKGYEAVDFTNLMACIWGSAGWGHPLAASGQNLAYLREAFTAVGGYEKVMHRASGDDVLLMQMIRKTGKWSIAFASAPETFARHPVTPSWRALIAKRGRWASNATALAGLDPLFFGYMVITYVFSGMILAAPLLCWAGLLAPWWALGAFAVKVLAEWSVFSRGISLSGRRELRRYFPCWTLLQPLHLVLVGTLGALGLFRWKGRSHLWGRRVPNRDAKIDLAEPLHR